MAKKSALFLIVVLFFITAISALISSETIRSRAETHFAIVGWSLDPSFVPAVERKSLSIPGGAETFSAMTPAFDAGLVSVYPSLEGLGCLDYSELDASLLALFANVSDCFKKREIATNLCDPALAFLAPVNSYRLGKLPEILSARFSRPSVSETGASGIFRLLCVTGKNNKTTPLFVTVTAAQNGSVWVLTDITFDGKMYAELAEQN